ncbi:MAG: hypothetical protein HF962_06740 [Sulfurovum sp.]|nr:hypothetical protein [Sulfurovum sp.]
MRKVILSLILFTVTLFSCPFDEAGVDMTVLWHKNIYGSAKSGNFNKAEKQIIQNKKLYKYFGSSVYNGLIAAAKSKNKARIKQILDGTLKSEVKEYLGQAERSFSKYQQARLHVVKAKRHLRALTRSRQSMGYIKKILKSLGNPGLSGLGKRPANKAEFKKYKSLLLRSI